MSAKTVETHIGSIFAKLGLGTRRRRPPQGARGPGLPALLSTLPRLARARHIRAGGEPGKDAAAGRPVSRAAF